MLKNNRLFLSITLLLISSIMTNISAFQTISDKEPKTMTTSTSISKIRQIGDPTLHTPTPLANIHEAKRVADNILVMKEDQKQYQGVGIACNQSVSVKDPLAIIIVGTPDEGIKEAAQKRYPDNPIPDAMIMLNPRLVSHGEETYYPEYGEGCLSVQGPIRGKVKRYKTVTVSYEDLNGNEIERQFSGFAAHIVQHEIDHLKGTVFLQKILSDCTAEKKKIIADLVEKEINRRKLHPEEFAMNNDPILIFDRKGDEVIFNAETLSLALTKTPESTLRGILIELKQS